jgi:hypothetical protein
MLSGGLPGPIGASPFRPPFSRLSPWPQHPYIVNSLLFRCCPSVVPGGADKATVSGAEQKPAGLGVGSSGGYLRPLQAPPTLEVFLSGLLGLQALICPFF